MTYNLTLISNSTGYLNFVQTINSNILDGYLGTILLVIIFAITFIGFIAGGFEPKRSLIGSSFIILTLSMPLRIMELVPTKALIISMLLVMFSVGWSLFKN